VSDTAIPLQTFVPPTAGIHIASNRSQNKAKPTTEEFAGRLREQFQRTRKLSARLTQKLSPEDQQLQSMPDASPTKWHLAHTTWFFDTFILLPRDASVAKPGYEYLFNSYYNQVGPQFRRAQRGILSRPSLDEIWDYRFALEEKLITLWDALTPAELQLIELGIHHEQQHQELIVTDIKHALSFNPLYPKLVDFPDKSSSQKPELHWRHFAPGESWFGCDDGFHFDNEAPLHRAYVHAFRLASRPVINAEYLEFMADGGYRDPRHWLSEGWAWVQENHIEAPLYWINQDGEWWTYTLAGLRPVAAGEPVCHISYFEASAFASWAGKRLPTEYEWELAAQFSDAQGNFLDPEILHPHSAENSQANRIFGNVWQWTQSAYLPYPGYVPPAGAVGEYNGKFMVNQWVLRGGSCATPPGHIRPSYRNFFPVGTRWQFSGVRLADDFI